ncbi:MAG TPA: 2-dehydropantoate 2-reductase [Dehalococcoidia bacterium]|nr:2-dehydropantoate 2-reductase [Dehalococcoidia bacterium]
MNKRIGILGIGAIGGTIGAYLLRAGHDITLMDQWAAHIEKIRSDGLKLTDPENEFTVPAKALHLSDVSGLREQFDIVYLSVKSYDTRWSTYFIEPYLKPTGFILPAQNSLNDELVASIVGFNRTVGCVPSIGGAIYEPGHIVRTYPMTIHCFTVGELSGVITPRVTEIVDSLKIIGPSEATNNIWGARWSKMIINCMMNTIAGLIGPSISSLNDEQRNTLNLIRVVSGGEVSRVAHALGVDVEPIWDIPAREFAEATSANAISKLKDKVEVAVQKLYLTPEQTKRVGVPGRPSLLQDVIKGRRTEVDFLNGYAVKRGEELGVATPMNKAIVDLMKKVEKGEVHPAPSMLEQLKAYLST